MQRCWNCNDPIDSAKNICPRCERQMKIEDADYDDREECDDGEDEG